MNHDSYTDLYISDILESTKTVAMVGASANTNRPSYFAMKYMLAKGFTVHPINPGQAGKEILGQTVYADLADVPAPVDMVDIFRSSEAAGEIVDYAIGLAPKLAIKVIWMQLGVRNDAAAAHAEAAGLKVVMNRCPKIEYGRLTGELGWAGVNTRKISNNRPQMAAFGVQDHRLKPRT
jgi:predicted CoA-binding protein